jgi:hypothetical protein
MATSEILDFTETPIIDEGIEKYELHEYEPVARTNLNSAGEIRINIEQQDLFVHNHQKHIYYLKEGLQKQTELHMQTQMLSHLQTMV